MSIFKSISRVVANTVSLPISLAKDLGTGFGILTKQDKPYTLKTGQKLVDSVLDLDADLQKLGEKDTDNHR